MCCRRGPARAGTLSARHLRPPAPFPALPQVPQLTARVALPLRRVGGRGSAGDQGPAMEPPGLGGLPRQQTTPHGRSQELAGRNANETLAAPSPVCTRKGFFGEDGGGAGETGLPQSSVAELRTELKCHGSGLGAPCAPVSSSPCSGPGPLLGPAPGGRCQGRTCPRPAGTGHFPPQEGACGLRLTLLVPWETGSEGRGGHKAPYSVMGWTLRPALCFCSLPKTSQGLAPRSTCTCRPPALTVPSPHPQLPMDAVP